MFTSDDPSRKSAEIYSFSIRRCLKISKTNTTVVGVGSFKRNHILLLLLCSVVYQETIIPIATFIRVSRVRSQSRK